MRVLGPIAGTCLLAAARVTARAPVPNRINKT
jgi:hypothetical protein